MEKNLITSFNYDFFYNSTFLKKFLNNLMKGGKGFIIEKIVYGFFKDLKFINVFYKKHLLKVYYLPIYIFFEVIIACRPLINFKLYKPSARKGKKKRKKKTSSMKSVRILLFRNRSYNVGISWVIKSILLRRDLGLKNKILNEFIDVTIFKYSDSLKSKARLYSLLSQNKMYTHFRWHQKKKQYGKINTVVNLYGNFSNFPKEIKKKTKK